MPPKNSGPPAGEVQPSPEGAPPAAGVRFSPLPGHGLVEGEVELGNVSGVYSYRGEVRLFLHHRDSCLLHGPRPVVLVSPDGRRWRAKMSARSGAGARVIGRVDGVRDEALARSLMGWTIAIALRDLPPAEDDTYYVAMLQGAAVWCGDRELGTVVTVHETEGNDVMELLVNGEQEFVVMHADIIAKIDVAARRVELRHVPWDDA
jgi:16S rRNA processing protein RimM